MMDRKGHNNADGSFNWRDALVDAGICAGLTFFTTISAALALGPIGSREFAVATGAAGAQFFIWLAMKRGITE